MLDKLNAKYDPLKSAPPPSEPQPGGGLPPALPKELSSWQDSAAVVGLSEYLKQNKTQGIKLYQTADGRPALYFLPGLGKADLNTERWHIAQQSFVLFDAALPDLELLLDAGLLTLPTNPAQPSQNSAGPSQPPESIRAAEPQNLTTFNEN